MFRCVNDILFFLCSEKLYILGVRKSEMTSRTSLPFGGNLGISEVQIFYPLFKTCHWHPDLNIQLIGSWDRNHNLKSAVRSVALNIFQKSIKMAWSSLYTSKEVYILLLVLHQLFFLLTYSNNQESNMGSIIFHERKGLSWKHITFFSILIFQLLFPISK